MGRGRPTLYPLLFFLIAINCADRIALSIGAQPIGAGPGEPAGSPSPTPYPSSP